MTDIDIEGDFWKNRFSAMHRENMFSKDGLRLNKENSDEAISEFKNKFPALVKNISANESSIEMELHVSEKIMLRVFIQNQIKVSIFQKIQNDFLKISDAKFPYSPFPQLEAFIGTYAAAENELDGILMGQKKAGRQQRFTGEIIKALLMKKFRNSKIDWHLEYADTGFYLIIENNGAAQKQFLSMENFMDEIKEFDAAHA